MTTDDGAVLARAEDGPPGVPAARDAAARRDRRTRPGTRFVLPAAAACAVVLLGWAATLAGPEVALLVLAVGSGSLFLSHVNDAGFWLVKQYLGTDLPQTFKTWTVLECLISVVGLLGVLLLNLVV